MKKVSKNSKKTSVIILQRLNFFENFCWLSKIPLELCWNTNFHRVWSLRSVWKWRQQNMKYVWSHGMFWSNFLPWNLTVESSTFKSIQSKELLSELFMSGIWNNFGMFLLKNVEKSAKLWIEIGQNYGFSSNSEGVENRVRIMGL